MQLPSFSHRRPRGFCGAGTFKPSRRQMLHPILAHLPSSDLQQRRDATIPKAAVLAGKRHVRLRQPILVGALRGPIALCGSPLPAQAAGVPFTYSPVPCVLNGVTSPRGTWKFPSAMSFNTCFSSVSVASALELCVFFLQILELLRLLDLQSAVFFPPPIKR